MRKSFVIAALMLLAGCQQSTDTTTSDKAAEQGTAPARLASLQPGEWESRFEILNVKLLPIETPEGTFTPGLVRHSPPSTSRSCLTAKDAAQPHMRFLVGGSAPDCKTDAFVMANGRISGSLACTGLGERTTHRLDGRYTATSYDVRTTAEVRIAGSPPSPMIPTATPMDMTSRVTGRRIGDCPAG